MFDHLIELARPDRPDIALHSVNDTLLQRRIGLAPVDWGGVRAPGLVDGHFDGRADDTNFEPLDVLGSFSFLVRVWISRPEPKLIR